MTFLSAEWRKLAIVNYVVDRELLYPFLPKHTELDLWNGKCYLSLMGFMFLNTSIYGIKIPFHINFEEVNLRFYVKYKSENSIEKRGVVFIKEVVPKKAITWLANSLYHENYETMLTKHEWKNTYNSLRIAYFWGRFRWNSIWVEASPDAIETQAGSDEEFITEHYWGYTKIDDHRTMEYEVVHPKWLVYPVKKCYVDVSFDRIYGKEFAFLRNQNYDSVFLAEGSKVKIKHGNVIN